uniref:ATP synthase complex subunit 8 n=1 Tax=Geoffmonteithia queenslanda TaxID=2546578 RepID=A0A6H0N1W3_9CUCU|nr:ATP synthase F0 subunit 8 [Geoffmonteithia queenslanda]
MPQMAPLNWLTLAILFILVFLLFNIVNYFSFFYKSKKLDLKGKKITTNWKW